MATSPATARAERMRVRAGTTCRAEHGQGSCLPPGPLAAIGSPAFPACEVRAADRCRGRYERKKAVIIGPAALGFLAGGS